MCQLPQFNLATRSKEAFKIFHCSVKIFHNSQIGLLIAVKALLVEFVSGTVV